MPPMPADGAHARELVVLHRDAAAKPHGNRLGLRLR